MRDKQEFSLLTEEDFRHWISEHKDFERQYLFNGYCTLTQRRVEFGPDLISRHNCENCYPESHFIMVPNDLLMADN